MEAVATFFGAGVLTFMLCGMFWARSREKKDWNGGTCTVCPGSPHGLVR